MQKLFTKLYLKENVTNEMMRELVIKWVTGSPHYHFENLASRIEAGEENEIESIEKQQKFSYIGYESDGIKLQCYKLENIDDKTLWTTECIVVENGSEKYVTISLNCDRAEYKSKSPHNYKPYILRLLVESGYCRVDGQFAVSDTAIFVSQENIDYISKIMTSEAKNYMPMVYVSSSDIGYEVDVDKLAIWLSGIAHIIVEPSKEWSYRLKESTGSRNAHRGYIGIYYPQSLSYELFSRSDYNNCKEMEIDISRSVQQALVNYEDIEEYNWNKVVYLLNKKKIVTLQMRGEAKEAELEEYVASFDSMNKDLNEKVRSLTAQLEVYKNLLKTEKADNALLNGGDLEEFFIDEKKDLVLSLLCQMKDKIPKGNRAEELLESILTANQFTNNGTHVLNEVKKVLYKGGKLNSSLKSDLKAVGFEIIDEGGHPKLLFHNNQKYKFTISGTPGSSRDGKNLYTDIDKKINIYKKFI